MAFDLIESLGLLAKLASTEGDRTTELEHLQRARALLDDMNARGHIQGYAARERLLQEITDPLSS